MDILISYDDLTIPVALAAGDNMALYAVPTAYSEDGCTWRNGEPESWNPCPRAEHGRRSCVCVLPTGKTARTALWKTSKPTE